ncbi:unnamed protein product [Nesidiocoris tenuis]|uniref:ditrans,polycis-polyprenyl diphosphate synthase [(2E,6E)-farnesyldiphosphate specific] n=1 Tax=Nesidiocoris tenuis TaxID=355587 RepID=A0A6H5FZP5_9HEMI|nr:unnamed protein product [Nesidiocoris tenuis]
MNEQPVPGLLAQAVNGLFFSHIVTFFGTLALSLLHHVYGFYLWLNGLVEDIRDFVLKTESVVDEGDDIRRTICMLKKLPSHLVLILGAESPSYHDIVKLITWCLPAGIAHVSIYDHKDGYSWSPAVTVHVLRSSDGPELIADAVSQLRAERVAVGSSGDLGVADVDRFVKRRLAGVPEPDLAVICGPTFTFYGCCPWNMRITQMHEPSVRRFLYADVHRLSQFRTLHEEMIDLVPFECWTFALIALSVVLSTRAETESKGGASKRGVALGVPLPGFPAWPSFGGPYGGPYGGSYGGWGAPWPASGAGAWPLSAELPSITNQITGGGQYADPSALPELALAKNAAHTIAIQSASALNAAEVAAALQAAREASAAAAAAQQRVQAAKEQVVIQQKIAAAKEAAAAAAIQRSEAAAATAAAIQRSEAAAAAIHRQQAAAAAAASIQRSEAAAASAAAIQRSQAAAHAIQKTAAKAAAAQAALNQAAAAAASRPGDWNPAAWGR